MNKEKQQIEEMAITICRKRHACSLKDDESCRKCDQHERCLYQDIAYALYQEDYRKQSENTIELPCKVGDTVWHIRRTPEHRGGSYIVEAKIICIPIRVYPNEVYFDLILRYTQRNGMPEEASSILGKYAFPTKEETEQALAKMKGGE